MKNSMQLKAIIRNIAKEKHISAQLVLQNFMLERLLERISVSKYQKNIILKGGFLIAAIVGLDVRATMDMDTTIKGWKVNEETIRNMFSDICNIDVNDDVEFEIKSIKAIRESADYTGYRISFSANYPPMSVPLKLDITTGDVITPKEIEYKYKLLLENREISVLAYNLDTILSEKLETIVSRGDQNTRPRDYYDVYVLAKLQSKNINFETLNKALILTSQNRGTIKILNNYEQILNVVSHSETMIKEWNAYQKENYYAKDISFDETCKTILFLLDSLNIQSNI